MITSAPAAPGKKLKRSGAPVDEPAASAFATGGRPDEDAEDDDAFDSDDSEFDSDDSGGSDEEVEEDEETEEERVARAARAKAEGTELYKKKDFRGAIGKYTEAIEADPKNAMYINNRAAAHLALGNWDKAIDDGALGGATRAANGGSAQPRRC